MELTEFLQMFPLPLFDYTSTPLLEVGVVWIFLLSVTFGPRLTLIKLHGRCCGRLTPRQRRRKTAKKISFRTVAMLDLGVRGQQSHYGNVDRFRKRDLGDRRKAERPGGVGRRRPADDRTIALDRPMSKVSAEYQVEKGVKVRYVAKRCTRPLASVPANRFHLARLRLFHVVYPLTRLTNEADCALECQRTG